MTISFTDDDQKTVNQLQADLTQVLLRANEAHVEAALAIFALCRCARILLDRYPSRTRDMLCQVVVGFLQGDTEAPESDGRLLRFH